MRVLHVHYGKQGYWEEFLELISMYLNTGDFQTEYTTVIKF